MERNINAEVTQLVAQRLGMSLAQVTPNASLEKDLKADSLDAADMLQALNETYRIRITLEQMEKVSTVADLIELVQKHVMRQV